MEGTFAWVLLNYFSDASVPYAATINLNFFKLIVSKELHTLVVTLFLFFLCFYPIHLLHFWILCTAQWWNSLANLLLTSLWDNTVSLATGLLAVPQAVLSHHQTRSISALCCPRSISSTRPQYQMAECPLKDVLVVSLLLVCRPLPCFFCSLHSLFLAMIMKGAA